MTHGAFENRRKAEMRHEDRLEEAVTVSKLAQKKKRLQELVNKNKAICKDFEQQNIVLHQQILQQDVNNSFLGSKNLPKFRKKIQKIFV